MFYRPSFQRTQRIFRLDNERVPGRHVLMLEDPSGPIDLDQPWADEQPPVLHPQVERVISFDLTDTDAIVIN